MVQESVRIIQDVLQYYKVIYCSRSYSSFVGLASVRRNIIGCSILQIFIDGEMHLALLVGLWYLEV